MKLFLLVFPVLALVIGANPIHLAAIPDHPVANIIAVTTLKDGYLEASAVHSEIEVDYSYR
jgi:hypothetical protein